MDHNFIKVSLLQTLAVTNDYDIICLTETFLDSLVENDDDWISIPGYYLLSADHKKKKRERERESERVRERERERERRCLYLLKGPTSYHKQKCFV